MTPSPGDRVVVRFRKGPGAPADWRADESATLSDVTGVLDSESPDLVILRGADRVVVSKDLVVAVKVLSDRPVRNSQIRSLEVAAARGWPGVESEWIDGWLARAGGGFTRRANSAVPLEMGARLDAQTMDRLSQWYRVRGLPLRIAAVTRLLPGAHVSPADYVIDVDVLVAPVGSAASDSGVDVAIDETPSNEWVAAYVGQRDGADRAVAAAVVGAVDGGQLGFATVRDDEGALLSIGRGAVTTGLDNDVWLGLSALWTSADHRGRGLGRAVTSALESWGAHNGASHTYLQVETGNTHARDWYRRMGFGLHHSYGYVEYP
ncbi:N-acetylglutamate synthase, CG3035 family [Williamsia soli]|uniref:N-acetylglutamate synthase, CG3035 family n=1 Tax=Williamsia soli TaxID=364929 RepID=UPI001A9E5129|nr:GNAT family N-acetyltransferase [Williamsia soli]